MGSATPPHRRRTSDLALDRSRTCHEVVGNHRPTRGVRRGVHRAAKRPVRRVTYSSEVRNVPDVRNFVYPNWDPSEPPLVADYLVGGTRVNRMRRLSHSRFCKQHRDRCSKRSATERCPAHRSTRSRSTSTLADRVSGSTESGELFLLGRMGDRGKYLPRPNTSQRVNSIPVPWTI
jgi:hypothetical protein